MLSDLYRLNLGNATTVGVGASTCVCSVMGLYIAKLYISSKKSGRVGLAKRQIITMLIYLLIISVLPGVDFFGHFGSLFSGVLLGGVMLLWDDIEMKTLKLYAIIGFAVYSLLLLTLFV